MSRKKPLIHVNLICEAAAAEAGKQISSTIQTNTTFLTYTLSFFVVDILNYLNIFIPLAAANAAAVTAATVIIITKLA